MIALHPAFARLRAIAPVLILAACAQPVATTPYVPPAPAQASARLLMRNALESADSYEVAVFDNAETCSGRERVGTGNQTVNPKSTTIAAGRWQTVEVVVSKPNRTVCRIRWSFTPATGRSYLVSTASRTGGCSMMILDATNPDALRIEPSLRRRNAGNNLCVAIAQSKAIQLADTHGGDDTSDLPIAPQDRVPPATKPAARAPAPKAPSAVTNDDLQGLIGP